MPYAIDDATRHAMLLMPFRHYLLRRRLRCYAMLYCHTPYYADSYAAAIIC